MPIVREGTPNGDAKEGFRRVIDAFFAALLEKEQRLHDDAQALADERALQQTTGQQEHAT